MPAEKEAKIKFWSLLPVLPGIVRAYRWATRVEGQALVVAPAGLPTLWVLSLVSIFSLIVPIIVLFKTRQLDFLNGTESSSESDTFSSLSALVDASTTVFSQIARHSLGTASFVILVSTTLVAIAGGVVVAWIAFRESKAYGWKKQFEIACYQMFSASCRFALCCFVSIVISIGIDNIGGKQISLNEPILFCLLALTFIGTICWIALPKRKALSKDQLKRRGRLAGWFFITALFAVYVLLSSTVSASKLYPPTLSIVVSKHCGADQKCVVFLKTSNSKSVVVDSEISFDEWFFPFTESRVFAMDRPQVLRRMKMEIASIDEKEQLVVLEPGKEKMAIAENVSYCVLKTANVSSPVPPESSHVLLHVPDSNAAYAIQRLTVEVAPHYGALVRQASVGAC